MGKGDKRGGKPRKPGKRTPSGRLSQAAAAVAERRESEVRVAFEEGPQQTVLRARRRQRKEFTEPESAARWRRKDSEPVTKDQVREQQLDKRGSVLGRWLADGKLTAEQVRIGEDYCARYIAYAKTNGIPQPTPKIASYGSVRGSSRPERIEAAIKAKVAHMADRKALHMAGAGVYWAINRACINDEPAPLHLVRKGLKSIVSV